MGDDTNLLKDFKIVDIDMTNELGRVCYLASDCESVYLTFKTPRQLALEKIEKVIFNDPATIVFWADGTKTVVKTQGDDKFDPEKGLAMAISKKYFGNNGFYCDVFKKFLGGK